MLISQSAISTGILHKTRRKIQWYIPCNIFLYFYWFHHITYISICMSWYSKGDMSNATCPLYINCQIPKTRTLIWQFMLFVNTKYKIYKIKRNKFGNFYLFFCFNIFCFVLFFKKFANLFIVQTRFCVYTPACLYMCVFLCFVLNSKFELPKWLVELKTDRICRFLHIDECVL